MNRPGSALLGLLLAASVAAAAQAQHAPVPGLVSVPMPHPFDVAIARLEKTIADNGMGLVALASASRGAAARGVQIRGNAVLMVFRNDYAVRMLEASVPAGFEAPLRIYVTEKADRSTLVSYRTPSAVFAPYGVVALDRMARELDPVFERIVKDAAAR